MAGQLRYELIGDASQFSSAAQEVIQGSKQIEGSLEALEGNIAAVTEGQIQLNEAAGRFRDSSGQFVSGAEAQAQVLEELNSEGVQTTQQIREQIERLERLESIYQEDAKASSELSDRQQQLRTQLAEVGVAAAQQNRDLSRLDQQFGEATVEMTDFANRQSRLQSELRATAAAQERVQSSGVTMRSGVRASANNLGFEFVQAAQDARFGAAGVANQIPLMTEQFTQLQAKTGSTTAALRALGSSFFGTAGIIGAITLGLPLLEDLVSGLGEAEDSASDFQESVQSAANSVFELADASREGLTLTQQFGQSTISTLETTISQLQTQLNRLQDREPIRPGIGAPAPGFLTVESFAPQEELDQLSESQEVRESAVETIREQIQERRVKNRLLQAQVQSITESSTLSEQQAESLQDQSASLTTVAAAAQQGVIPLREAERLAEARLQSTNAIGASQSVINQLVSQEVVSFTDVLDAARSTQRQHELINEAVEAGLISQQRANDLIKEYKQDSSDAADESFRISEEVATAEDSVAEMRAKYRELRGPQGVALAQARRRKEEVQGAVRGLQAANRILARREDDDAIRATGVEGAPQDLEEAAVSAENLATAMERVNENISEFNEQTDQAAEKTKDAGDEVDSNINNQIARGIQLSAQLGATLVQSARQGGFSFQQAFSSILQTVGQVLALTGNPVLGAALGGAGSFVGAFQDGGRVPRSGLAFVGEAGPELVNLPGGAEVKSNKETQQIMAQSPAPSTTNVNVTADLARVGPGELGIVIREVERYQSKHPPRR
jgi:DNA repair exonuclease SbcCD ATPase subunit